jgi:GTPase-associated system helical domain
MPEQAQSIDPNFPRWYGVVSIGSDRETIQRRWLGVTNLVSRATYADILAMLALMFKTKTQPTAESLLNIRKSFLDADNQFDAEHNEKEMQILCAATLLGIFKENTALSAIAGIATATTAFDGIRSYALPMDLTDTATLSVADKSVRWRSRVDLEKSLAINAPKVDLGTVAQYIKQNWTPEGAEKAVTDIAKLENDITSAILDAMKTIARASHRLARIQDEELQILSWLFNGYSTELSKTFDAIKPEIQPLVLGQELSKIIEFLPGPKSSKAILSRSGLKDKRKLSIPGAVNACGIDWLKTLVTNHVSAISQPIHSAIHRRIETGDEASWIAGWSAVTGIEEGYSVSPLAMADQFYRERLIAKFAGS